jgi:hypothetical protein
MVLRLTSRHGIHLQSDISVNALVIRAVQSQKCIVWYAVDYILSFYHIIILSRCGSYLNGNVTSSQLHGTKIKTYYYSCMYRHNLYINNLKEIVFPL